MKICPACQVQYPDDAMVCGQCGSRLMLDIAQWRKRRRDELAALGSKVARRVLETGEREELAPMTPFERKIVHDAVADVDGVHSESEGVEPSRRVVVLVD